jgi:hypothetical protein
VDLNDTPQHAEYRAKARAWLEEHKAHAPEVRGTRAGAEDDAYIGRAGAGRASSPRAAWQA